MHDFYVDTALTRQLESIEKKVKEVIFRRTTSMSLFKSLHATESIICPVYWWVETQVFRNV